MYVERDYPEIREAVGNGLTIKPLNTMMNHSSTELFIENLRVQVKLVVQRIIAYKVIHGREEICE